MATVIDILLGNYPAARDRDTKHITSSQAVELLGATWRTVHVLESLDGAVLVGTPAGPAIPCAEQTLREAGLTWEELWQLILIRLAEECRRVANETRTARADLDAKITALVAALTAPPGAPGPPPPYSGPEYDLEDELASRPDPLPPWLLSERGDHSVYDTPDDE
jgi:hypothetical protein